MEHRMTTRRAFVCAAASGIAAAPLPQRAGYRLNIGIGTYSYHTLSMDAMIEQLRALRIEEIEMSRGEFMLLSHPNDDLFRSARVNLDRAGIRCVSYYAATFKGQREVGDAVRFAKLLGAGNITGDATDPTILRKIDETCTAAGLTFGIHNHYFPQKFAYESPDDVLKVLAGLSRTVGATLDIGHIASCGFDTVDAVRKLGPYLKLVHLKDVKASGGEVNVLLGQGIGRIPKVMRELHHVNFRGLVAIEYEKQGPVEEDLRQEVEYARRLA